MRSLKVQFFITFAVMGCVLPYLPVYLREQRGLSDAAIGWIASVGGVAIMVMPVLMTLLADAHVPARRLIALMFGLCAAGLAVMLPAAGFWVLFAAHALYAFAIAPMMPLQDGLFFAQQHQDELAGVKPRPYHRIRVWGTYGFIAPGVVTWLGLRWGLDTSFAIVAGAGTAVLGLLHAPMLAATEPRPAGGRLPTLQAARAMAEPGVILFSLAMWLLHFATGGYYTYYPRLLSDTIGIADQWLGLISASGVVVEILFMLGFGWLLTRLGLRGLMVVGGLVMTLRFSLLWAFPNAVVGVGTQLLHGIMVIVVHVAPPIFFNQHAKPAYRSSMQGLYVMLIYGTARTAGNIAAGYIAEASLTLVFAAGAAACLLATLLFAVAPDRPLRA